MIGGEGLQPSAVLYSSNYGISFNGACPSAGVTNNPAAPDLFSNVAPSRARRGLLGDPQTLALRSSRSLTSSVANGGLSHHPFIQGTTIPLDNGRVICNVSLIAFSIKSHASLVVHARELRRRLF
jgi:hypothetical protein